MAVAGLDLDVPAGGVFGFLGPNGAGKTTTMRCLLGLVRPTAGSVRVLGADVPSELPRVIGAVGALVESPKFFPGFTGRLNLRLLADMEGYTARDVGRVLEEVGLADRADDLFSGYSLGMKQRLAVASTLLKDPELLILDVVDTRRTCQRSGPGGYQGDERADTTACRCRVDGVRFQPHPR